MVTATARWSPAAAAHPSPRNWGAAARLPKTRLHKSPYVLITSSATPRRLRSSDSFKFNDAVLRHSPVMTEAVTCRRR